MEKSTDIVRFEIPEDINREQLFGTLDANIKQVEKSTGTTIVMRDDGLFIKGAGNIRAANIISSMVENLRVEPARCPQGELPYRYGDCRRNL